MPQDDDAAPLAASAILNSWFHHVYDLYVDRGARINVQPGPPLLSRSQQERERMEYRYVCTSSPLYIGELSLFIY